MATIQRRGDRWRAQIRRKSCPTLSRSFRLKADAERWSAQIEAEGDRTGLVVDPRQLCKLTLGAVVERYRDTVVPKHRSKLTEATVLNAFLRQPICSTRLSELKPLHFAAYRDERLKVVRPGTLLRELGMIQHALELAAKEWGVPLSANPVKGITKPRPDRARERRLETGEWDRLAQASSDSRNPFLMPLVELALATGMRRGELLNARWKHLNWTASTLHIPETKNGEPRTIPLSTQAMRALGGLGLLWSYDDRIIPVTAEAAKLGWQRLIERAGIEDLHFHDLRHEAVSRFFELGLTVPEVALISGHKDTRMLLRYTHLKATDLAVKLRNLVAASADIGGTSSDVKRQTI